MRRRFLVWLAISVAVTVFIFSNSIESPEDSSSASSFVANMLRPLFEIFVDTTKFNFELFVRKLAHFVEFAALGVSVGCMTRYGEKLFRKHFRGYSLFYLLAIAVLDEFIQRFFERGSSVSDVLLDFSGAIFGVTVINLALLCVKKLKRTMKKPSSN